MTEDPEDFHDYDVEAPLVPSGNLRRRLVVNRLATGAATGAALLAVAVLGIVVYSVGHKGASELNLGFLTSNPPAFPGPGGGIAPAIVGSAIIVGLATAMAAPLGVLIALYLTEFAPRSRLSHLVRMSLDLLNGVPAIVIGVFVYGLMVVGHGGPTGFAGAVALGVIMLPLVARASQEVLLLVPGTMREAADALGVARWRTVLGVILPSALGGILTGTLLAIARAAGETAPLVLFGTGITPGVHANPFSSGHMLDSLPFSIFTASVADDKYATSRAWGAAFVLLMFILITSLGARALLNRNRRRLTG